jgi:MFS family permease
MDHAGTEETPLNSPSKPTGGDNPSKPTGGGPWASQPGSAPETHGPLPVGLEGKSWSLRSTFRSLRHRNYRLYFIGQLVSLVGTWVQGTALSWLAYDMTGQSKWPAFITVAQILPTLLLGPWGGALADRWPKRPLIFWMQSAFLILALVLAWLVMRGHVQLWQLLAITAGTGVVTAIDLPARLSFVMDMVGREDLPNAVALNSLLFNSARALGSLMAGWLMIQLGPGECFLANAASYLAVLLALAKMDISGRPPKHRGEGLNPRTQGHALLEGFRYLAARRMLVFLILLAGSTAFWGWPFLALLPALADKFGHAAQGTAWLFSGVGIGALVSALTLATFGSPTRAWAFITAGVIIVTGGLLGLAFAPNIWSAVLFAALIGFGLILFLATSQSVFQLSSEEHNRGRVMAIWAMVLSGAVPFGNLLAGPAADLFGLTPVLAGLGLACGTVPIILVILLPPWRRRGRRTAVAC